MSEQEKAGDASPPRASRHLDAPVRFLRTQNGWCACVTIVYFALVAGGYAWARQPEDAWDQLTRTWLVMWESLAGCLFMFAIYLSAPSWWIKKSNTEPQLTADRPAGRTSAGGDC